MEALPVHSPPPSNGGPELCVLRFVAMRTIAPRTRRHEGTSAVEGRTAGDARGAVRKPASIRCQRCCVRVELGVYDAHGQTSCVQSFLPREVVNVRRSICKFWEQGKCSQADESFSSANYRSFCTSSVGGGWPVHLVKLSESPKPQASAGSRLKVSGPMASGKLELCQALETGRGTWSFASPFWAWPRPPRPKLRGSGYQATRDGPGRAPEANAPLSHRGQAPTPGLNNLAPADGHLPGGFCSVEQKVFGNMTSTLLGRGRRRTSIVCSLYRIGHI